MVITININNNHYECYIEKKKIKHSYFKLKSNNEILVTVNHKLTDKQILDLINKNIPKLINKNQRVEIITPYYIFGKEYDQNYFTSYLGLDTNYNNLHEIYIKLTMNKINELMPIVNQTIKMLHIKPLPIKVKVLKSKYGSIHLTKKYIVINAKLALLPVEYLLYVIYHEYAHVIEANHSKQFYNTVEKLMPNYLFYHRKLKKIKLVLG